MAQYQVGTIQVTNNSTTVTAVDPDPGDANIGPPQQWLAEITAGDYLILDKDTIWYEIQTVNTDTQLTLASPYQGTTTVQSGTPNAGDKYAIQRDFSATYDFMLLSAADKHTAEGVRHAINSIDTVIASLDARIAVLESA